VCTTVDVEGKDPRRRLLHTSIDHDRGNQQGRLRNCPISGGQHAVRDCREFNGASPTEKCRYVKRHRLCITCLQSGHMTRSCTSNGGCQFNRCRQRDHSLLQEADSQREDRHTKAKIEETTREFPDSATVYLTCSTGLTPCEHRTSPLPRRRFALRTIGSRQW